ncbi:MAG: TonB-dependent receptor [Candidatus Acidiferrales bacterium]
MRPMYVRLGMMVLLILGLATSLKAQASGRGALSGLITDSSGAAVPKAAVMLTNIATGVSMTDQTSPAGLYSFVSLIPGTYRLEVNKAGFRKAVQNQIAIAVDEEERVNIALQVGAVSETVTVTAAPGITATTSTTTGQLITSETIDRIPLVTRDVYALAQLVPGVIPQDGNPTSLDSGRNQVSNFSINGGPQGTIYYMLDGSPISIGENNQGVVIPALEPPLDSVEEFRMETNVTPASIQTGAAGVISLASKSGTNSFHGDVFGFIRPDGLDANDYFVKAAGEPIPDFHRYQWGGSLGGPIKRDKLFFFADYEGTKQASLATLTTTVPTAAEKLGDFSGDPGLTIYNPDPSTWAAGPTPCIAPATVCPQPFAGNKIPTINAIAQNYLQYWPGPTSAGTGTYHRNNFFGSGSNPEADERFDVRLDDNISSKQHLFGRVSVAREHDSSPNYFKNLFYPESTNINHNANIMLGYDRFFSSNTVLQLRSSGTRHYENDGPQAQAGYDQTKLGFLASLAASSVFPSIPYVDITDNGGVQPLGSPTFSFFKFATTNFDFSAILNTVKGRHQLSLGFDFQKFFMNVGQTLDPAGAYQFAPDATSSNVGADDGDAFASFLLGVGSLSQGQPNWTTDIFGANSNPYAALFIQDEWHVTDKLTINAGLRWDVFPGVTERHNRMEYFDPTLGYQVNGVNLTGGEVFSTNAHRSPFLTNWRDFAPRVGLTYQFMKNAVVRGGFGISYGPSVHMAAINQFNDDSYLAETTWLAASLDPTGNYLIPGDSLANPFPNGILKPTMGSLGPATNLGNGVNSVLHSQPELTTYNFNFGVQYEFPHDVILSVAWVGSRGLHLPFSNNTPDFNALSLGTIAQYQNNLLNMVPFPYAAAITDPTAPWFGATQVPQWVMLEKFPQFSYSANPNGSGVLEWGVPFGDSIYHSLQAKLEKRLTQHFTTLASFTWGKLITDDNSGSLAFNGNNYATPQDFTNLNLERDISTQDIPFYFSWELSYDLPIGAGRALELHGLANQALGGWTLTTIATLGSGQPIATPNGTGDIWFNQRPDIVGSCGSGAPKTVDEWFNYICMAQPPSDFLPGTAPPILPGIRADGAHNLDLSLAKHFKWGEHRDLLVRVAAYNLTNSVQFGYPNVFWNPPASGTEPTPDQMDGFGQITNAANTPRQLSFEVRFMF